jgi:hypothetical protein
LLADQDEGSAQLFDQLWHRGSPEELIVAAWIESRDTDRFGTTLAAFVPCLRAGKIQGSIL